MAFMRALVQLNRDSNVPVDRVVNTWHFRTPGSVADAAPTVTTLLDTFYTSLGALFSPVLTGTGDITYYDLEDVTPRAPVAEGTVTFTPDTTGLPSEVAIVMSFQGPIVSGLNQARRRGRIYLGPLSDDGSQLTLADYRPSSSVRTSIAGAASALMTDTTLPGLIWSVFSPTTAGPEPWDAGSLGDAFVTVTNGWINDSYDTMRSRGADTTARTVWP